MDTKDPEDLPVVVPPRSSWWHHIISGPGKEPLSRDTSIGMAIGLAGLAAAMLPLDWMTRVVLTLFVMGLTIYAASKHPAHPIIRIVATLAVIALFVGFGSRPAWEDFHVKHPTVLLPESMNGLFQPYVIPPKAPPPPSPAAPKPTESTVGSAHYKCGYIQVEWTKAEAEKNATNFKTFVEEWAAANNFKPPIVTTIANGSGNRAELTPQQLSEPFKRTFQLVKVGKELNAAYSADYTSPYTRNQPLSPNSPLESTIRKAFEGLANVEPGTCELQ